MGMDEKALCVSSKDLENLSRNMMGMDGRSGFPKAINFKTPFFVPAHQVSLGWIVRVINSPDKRGPLFVPRSLCETDTSLRQICSYCIIDDAGMIGSYTRSKAGGESRLYGNRSIGFGGHITEEDFIDGKVTEESILIAVQREIDEEISISDEATYHYMGMLLVTESDDPVHLVHAGLVYEIRLPMAHRGILPKEDSIAHLGVSSLNWTRNEWGGGVLPASDSFEKWSEILLGVLANPRTTFFE